MKYTVGSLSGLTGLSTHTIRAWERRYQALTPDRTQTNRRQYDDADLERLKLLNKIVCRGHSIGQVASLPTEQLRAFAAAHCGEGEESEGRGSCCDLYNVTLEAMLRMDAAGLEDAFNRGMALYGIPGLLAKVVVPLISEIDRRWQEQTITIAQEHLASSVLRTFLDRTRSLVPAKPCAPRLLVTTPRNQNHDLGALLVAIVASVNGWKVCFVGANLPAEDIAAAVKQVSAKAVALSIVYPLDDKCLPNELLDLRRLVGPNFPIVAGGRGAEAYGMALKAIHAHVEQDLWNFGRKLAAKISGSVPSRE